MAPLIELPHHPCLGRQLAGGRIIGDTGDRRAILPLLETSHDPDDAVRWHASQCLSALVWWASEQPHRSQTSPGPQQCPPFGGNVLTTETPPAYTRHFWGKADRYDHTRIHLLEHHLADVGACFEALMALPTIRRRMARSAGLEELDPVTVARLCVFAALHDIGKVNIGFQTQIWEPQYLLARPVIHKSGHTVDFAPVLNGEDSSAAQWFFGRDALGWWKEALDWDSDGGVTTCALLTATISHHGRPLQLHSGVSANPVIWHAYGELHPEACVRRLGGLIRSWFPDAFSADGPLMPSRPEFQHMFLGMCNLADWIGSNESWFEFVDTPQDDYIATARYIAASAVKAVGLDLTRQRSVLAGIPDFGGLFNIPGNPPANAIQTVTTLETPLDEPLVIIESETGSGKTEAALWRFARMFEVGLVDGLYFALPTRAAAVQIHRRVRRFAANFFPVGHTPPVVLAVPGYTPDPDAESVGLPDYSAWWEPDHQHHEVPWASENAKRFLTAQIAVGTVDQAMLGTLQVKNAHMRSASLARNLLVVDEVHASDAYMTTVLEALLSAHLDCGGYALLMSATLGSSARRRWLSAGSSRLAPVRPLSVEEVTPYPAISIASQGEAGPIGVGENDQRKTVKVVAAPEMQDFAPVANRALNAARVGAKVLVVRNTVRYAIRTQQALEALAGPEDAHLLFEANGVPTLHHGRFAATDRRLLDSALEARLGRTRTAAGLVVVGTQTLEQSLDIDADLLITDLCPVDVLLQRIGRLHRHRRSDRPEGHGVPACVVLTPPGDDLFELLGSGQNASGLGPYGYVYPDLRVLEATRRLIAQFQEWRIPEMNRLLVERATHPDGLNAIVEELGEDWRSHANEIQGMGIAREQTGRGHVIRRNSSFFEENDLVQFPWSDQQVRTRLGDDQLDIPFTRPQASPFGTFQAIDKMPVTVRWLPSVAVVKAVDPIASDGGFTFTVGDRGFRYDRWGLRREETGTR